MAFKRTPETITIKRANPAGGYTEETVTINVANAGVRQGSFKGQWDICHICAHEFPISEMVLIQGNYYCTKYKDAQSKLEQLRKERLS